jgi:hypothetical protein
MLSFFVGPQTPRTYPSTIACIAHHTQRFAWQSAEAVKMREVSGNTQADVMRSRFQNFTLLPGISPATVIAKKHSLQTQVDSAPCLTWLRTTWQLPAIRSGRTLPSDSQGGPIATFSGGCNTPVGGVLGKSELTRDNTRWIFRPPKECTSRVSSEFLSRDQLVQEVLPTTAGRELRRWM